MADDIRRLPTVEDIQAGRAPVVSMNISEGFPNSINFGELVSERTQILSSPISAQLQSVEVPAIKSAPITEERGKYVTTSNEQREKIVSLFVQEVPRARIASTLGIKYATVCNVIRRYLATGETRLSRKGGAFHRKILPVHSVYIYELLCGEPEISFAKIRSALIKKFNLTVGLSTICGHILHGGLEKEAIPSYVLKSVEQPPISNLVPDPAYLSQHADISSNHRMIYVKIHTFRITVYQKAVTDSIRRPAMREKTPHTSKGDIPACFCAERSRGDAKYFNRLTVFVALEYPPTAPAVASVGQGAPLQLDAPPAAPRVLDHSIHIGLMQNDSKALLLSHLCHKLDADCCLVIDDSLSFAIASLRGKFKILICPSSIANAEQIPTRAPVVPAITGAPPSFALEPRPPFELTFAAPTHPHPAADYVRQWHMAASSMVHVKTLQDLFARMEEELSGLNFKTAAGAKPAVPPAVTDELPAFTAEQLDAISGNK
eukprot:gnl/Chilomastix_cuspidata/1861.p1 GENE.gnl/Chilomastix_cuspidata/1861~~gnl/Chilomastix_cuspidata/1861.p1  ORF type:complete len:489 (-),score=212.30 gnl/Chilomastix_cuspidata/1861:55-1521(-)